MWFHYETPPEQATPISPTDAARDDTMREWTLRVDLRIPPGQLAALVGPSAARRRSPYLVPRL